MNAKQKQRVPPKKPARKGRPTIYTEAVAQEICERIAGGESLRNICAGPRMPNQSTVLRWLFKVDESEELTAFLRAYRLARDCQAELIADEIIDIADEATDRDTAAAAQVRIAARKWIAAKLLPKKYGDTQKIEHGGKVETALPTFVLNFGGAPKEGGNDND